MATKKQPADTSKKLAPIRVKLLEKPVKAGEVLTVAVEGDYCSRYNEASAIAKAAGELMTELKPSMLPDALVRIFENNTEKPFELINSVAFRDEQDNVTRISFTAKYGDTTAKEVEDLFGKLKTKHGTTANVNDYVARTVEATFDSKVFHDAEGRFDKEKYDRIVEALDGVCKDLGVQNPLSTVVTVKPLASFHQRRWNDFSIADNRTISKVLKNTVTFTPAPNAVTGLMYGEKPEDKE
jgi:hypothetical protein